ncbi:cation:proton antiporter [Micromonospora sp. STR1_7]|uniref:Cation:proton antiporter n=1 Tax=Micromonospora parastrephiae TaxID=2806101 RepID=A0ABS1XQ62_9ACTN|nr:cation:proton antiporter [Micromonospora parastrephiae]MBM0231395.1 cation:proton antiporter [Micromonospora parastrephiae]
MTSHQIQLLFVSLAVILLVARVLAAAATRIGQPPVVGEIVAGILLGPTLLDGVFTSMLFPPELRPVLRALADVGVALFMFSVGFELEHRILLRRGRIVTGTVLGSLLVPFALGAGLAYLLPQRHSSGHPTAFMVFMGLAVSVTALPVLARIIKSSRVVDPAVAVIALAAAATLDVVAWTVLATVQAAAGHGGQYWRAALIVPFIVVLVFVVRPLLKAVLARSGGDHRPPGGLSSSW